MKKRICLALGVLVIAMSIFSPVLVWAEPEGENPGGSTEPTVVEPEQPDTPSTPDTKPEKPNSNSNKNNNKNNSSKNKNNNRESSNIQQQTPEYTGINEPAAESNIEKGVASIIFTHDMHSHLDSEMAKTLHRADLPEWQLLSRKYRLITKMTASYLTAVISLWEAHIRQYSRGMRQSLE